ncbi:unnamed protein product [Ixodes pacificus]
MKTKAGSSVSARMSARIQSLLERRSVVKQSCINKASGRSTIVLFTKASLGGAFIVLKFHECRFLEKKCVKRKVCYSYISRNTTKKHKDE